MYPVVSGLQYLVVESRNNYSTSTKIDLL